MPASSEKPVLLEIDGDVGIIRLNRPQSHNAVDEAVMEELASILKGVDHLRTLIVTGSGDKTFCAGGDLHYFASLKTRAQGLRMSRRMTAILDRLADGPQVVVAAINGRAVGGGCEILTACHFRIASSAATFCFRQAANGLITGWGGGIRLFQMIGPARGLQLLVTAQTITAQEAQQIGFVDDVVPSEAVMPAALQIGALVRANSAGAVGSFLELTRAYRTRGWRAREEEHQLFGERWISDDFRQELSAFLEVRKGKPK